MATRKVRAKTGDVSLTVERVRRRRSRKITKGVLLEHARSSNNKGQCPPEFHFRWRPILYNDPGPVSSQDNVRIKAAKRRRRKGAGKVFYEVEPSSRLSGKSLTAFVKLARQSGLYPVIIGKAGMSKIVKKFLETEHALMYCVDATGKICIYAADRMDHIVFIRPTDDTTLEALLFRLSWQDRMSAILEGCLPHDYPLVEVPGSFITPLTILYDSDNN